jgi:hypothetical protein
MMLTVKPVVLTMLAVIVHRSDRGERRAAWRDSERTAPSR